MPTPTFQPPQGEQDTAQLQDWIIKLVRDLNYLLGNLDTVNINRLDAKVIISQSITALQIATGTITADKMNVTQLSAIAADLGTIIAGTITGALIRTAASGTRIEISADKLRTYNAANKLNGMVWGNVTGFNYGDIIFYDADIGTVTLERQGTIGWLLSAKTGYTLQIGSNIASGKTLGGGRWDFPDNVFFNSAGIAIGGQSQVDSTATTVAGLVTDFNALLAKLRAMKVLT